MNFPFVLQILQVGFVGLAFLLAYMAYRLLHAQSEKEKPSKQVLDATSRYMVFALGMSLVAVVGQVMQPIVQRKQDDTGGRPQSADSPRIKSMESAISHLSSRLDGIRLTSRDIGESSTYGCGGTQKTEPDTLTVMYGLRDGTSCGVENVNYYKVIGIDVPK